MLLPMLGGVPTPQSVKDKWPCWCLLIGLFALLTVLKCMTLDIIAALLDCLMAILAYMIVRNGMRDANDMVLMYAVLTIMNFVFDLVPLIMGLEQGRISVSQGQTATQMGHGVEQISTTETYKTTPFFDSHASFRYNLQSFDLILSPIVQAFGVYLSVKATMEIQEAMPADYDEEQPFFQPQQRRGGGGGGGYGGGAPYQNGGGGGSPNQGGGGGGGGAGRGGQAFQPFGGQGHALGQT